jgi:F0F1-type ATP synthase membrane subunit b/b'
MEIAVGVFAIVSAVMTAAKTFEQIRQARKRSHPTIETELLKAELELAKLFKSAPKEIESHYNRARASLGASAVFDGE